MCVSSSFGQVLQGAVLALTRELAVIHARQGIRINALCPGPIRTDLLMKFLDTEKKRQRRLVHVPMVSSCELNQSNSILVVLCFRFRFFFKKNSESTTTITLHPAFPVVEPGTLPLTGPFRRSRRDGKGGALPRIGRLLVHDRSIAACRRRDYGGLRDSRMRWHEMETGQDYALQTHAHFLSRPNLSRYPLTRVGSRA